PRPRRARHGPPVGAQGMGCLVGVGTAADVFPGALVNFRSLSAAAAVRRTRLGSPGGRSRSVRDGECAVCVLVCESLAHDAPQNQRRAYAPALNEGSFLVLLRCVHAPLHHHPAPEDPPRKAPRGTRDPLSGDGGVVMTWKTAAARIPFAAIVLCSAVAPLAQQPPPPSAAQEGFVPVDQLPKPQDTIPAAPLVATAYAFVWVMLFGYVV